MIDSVVKDVSQSLTPEDGREGVGGGREESFSLSSLSIHDEREKKFVYSPNTLHVTILKPSSVSNLRHP